MYLLCLEGAPRGCLETRQAMAVPTDEVDRIDAHFPHELAFHAVLALTWRSGQTR